MLLQSGHRLAPIQSEIAFMLDMKPICPERESNFSALQSEQYVWGLKLNGIIAAGGVAHFPKSRQRRPFS
jgi:hypothetical protein